MDQIKLFEDLLLEVAKITYHNQDNFDQINQRARMYIRKFFGEESHYLRDLSSIQYSPLVFVIGIDNTRDNMLSFERGIARFKTIITIIIEDLKLSTNYPTTTTTTTTTTLPPVSAPKVVANPSKRRPLDGQTIQILIASPSDVNEERELLLNSLETKFRREGFEDQCGKRIILRGWEELASQGGYGQDIVNEQILSKVDIVLAVFKHKLGTPTIDPGTNDKRAESGTAEELLFAMNSKSAPITPLGMAYFYSEAPKMSFDSLDFQSSYDEWKRLKKFKEDIKYQILYKEYATTEKLLNQVCLDISENIKRLFE